MCKEIKLYILFFTQNMVLYDAQKENWKFFIQYSSTYQKQWMSLHLLNKSQSIFSTQQNCYTQKNVTKSSYSHTCLCENPKWMIYMLDPTLILYQNWYQTIQYQCSMIPMLRPASTNSPCYNMETFSLRYRLVGRMCSHVSCFDNECTQY